MCCGCGVDVCDHIDHAYVCAIAFCVVCVVVRATFCCGVGSSECSSGTCNEYGQTTCVHVCMGYDGCMIVFEDMFVLGIVIGVLVECMTGCACA